MAKGGSGSRLAWKDRIEQSSWVDDSRWLDDAKNSDSTSQATDGAVEFVEAEPSAYRLSSTTSVQPEGVFSSVPAKLLGLGGVAVVLLAVALMSRPSDEDPFSQLPPYQQQQILQRQAEAANPDQGPASSTLPQPVPTPEPSPLLSADPGSGSASDSDVDLADGDGFDPALLAPVPELRADLPEDMPDLLYTYGAAGSVIQIRRSEQQPTELAVSDSGAGTMQLSHSDELPLILSPEGLAAVLPGDGAQIEVSAVQASELLPADEGIVLVTNGRADREIVISSLLEDGGGPTILGYDTTLLGAWQSRPLVHKAGTVWIVDADGSGQRVSDGHIVGYDGQYLVMVRCDSPTSCRIEVGPPDQPDRQSVAVPEQLAGRDIASWASSFAVSRDGTRLAIVDQRGVSLPGWIDLVSGVITGRSESVNSDSPVVWSPDGRWLAYVFGDDLIIWDTERSQSWRVFVDRPISHLAWTLDDP